MAPVGLLVVEAFAGTYPAARTVQTLRDDFKHIAEVKAYVGIELDPNMLGLLQAAPAAADLGLTGDNYLNFIGDHDTPKGDVQNPEVSARVLKFIRRTLDDKSLDIQAVLVFGGPPCTFYTKATQEKDLYKHQRALDKAKKDKSVSPEELKALHGCC